MRRIAFSPRIVFVILFVLAISACGPAIGNTFSTISNSLPGEPSTEEPVPAAEEAPVEEGQPTQAQGGEVVPPPIYIAPSPQPAAQPALPERRRLTLEIPPRIRAGDSDRIRLTLEMDDLGHITPTAQAGGNVVTGEMIEIPNLYETHNVIAEAQFDITGLQISPAERVSQSLLPGQSVTFYWSILPAGVGIYRGTIWFYLRFVDKVSGDQSERAVSAQPVEIEAVNFLGLSANAARLFGAVGSVVGTVVGFPFIEDVVKFLFVRWKRGQNK